MNRFVCAMTLAAAMVLPQWVSASDVLETPSAGPQWDVGGDLRLRWVGQGKMPTYDKDPQGNGYYHGETKAEDFFRIRTRLWGEVTSEKIDAYLRITNEFRYYRAPHSMKGRQRFPDVTLIDNLYVTFKDVGDLVDIKIGRQDMAFGNRRVIAEGTPIDGSRTCYFDAVRLTFKFEEKRTLDAFALYIAREDWMPTLGHRHDPRSANTKSYHEDITAYNQNEYGAGLYYQDRSSAKMGWDLYYIFKGEEGSKSRILETGPFHSHTVGTRLLPQFTETISGEVELAVQAGDDNLLAAMAYAGLTYAPKWQYDPTFTIGSLYLSGDRDGQRGHRAWHSLFNRETALGDLVGAMYDAMDHCNLFYPHLAFGFKPANGQIFQLTTGPLFAPVSERDPDGGTYGKYRGYYAQAYYIVNIGQYVAKGTILEPMQFRILGEVMTKGDNYYTDQDDIGYYLEAQVTCAF